MHCVQICKRDMMNARPQPQSPWILFFDGATRESGNGNNPAGIGAVLKNGRGHTVVELKKLVGPGVSSGVAKYKSLIAGLKKALSLGVEFLLVKGDSRLIHSQVVGHCSVQDERLVEYQRKVMTLSKDFRALFVERISKEDNMRSDQLANDAIDEEMQVVDSLSEFIDQEWTSHEKHALQQHSVHSHHTRPHSHPHPLPLPTPHLKVKPVASVSPHVVKRHMDGAHKTTATKSDDSRRSRGLFCSADEEPTEQQQQQQMTMMSSPVRNHVQAAAKSRRSHRLLSFSYARKPEISASLLPSWDSSRDLNSSAPLSDESTANSEDSNLLQPAEGNSANTTDQAADGATTPDSTVSSSSISAESSSDAEFSEAEYARLVKTLLRGFLQRKKAIRS